MVITFLQRLLWLVALVALQMVLFNHIHLFGYATPLPYVFLLLLFPKDAPRWGVLLWGFACGLLCDVVSLSLGIGAGAMTLTALVQPVFLRLFAPKDSAEDLQASFYSLGMAAYCRYSALTTLVFTLAYFLLLSFNFFHLKDFCIACVSSWLITYLFCLAFEALRDKRSHG